MVLFIVLFIVRFYTTVRSVRISLILYYGTVGRSVEFIIILINIYSNKLILINFYIYLGYGFKEAKVGLGGQKSYLRGY